MPALRLATVTICISLAGCVTHEIREVPVPIKPPTLCVTDCPWPAEIPTTNGQLAESWRARGEALECYAARMQCVRELIN